MSTPPPNVVYNIRNVATSSLINLSGASSADNTPIIGWGQSNAGNEQWLLTSLGGANHYQITSVATGTVMQPPQVIHQQVVAQGTQPPGAWLITPVKNGQFTIGINPDFVANMWNAGFNQYSPVTLESTTNTTTQLFFFEQR